MKRIMIKTLFLAFPMLFEIVYRVPFFRTLVRNYLFQDEKKYRLLCNTAFRETLPTICENG